MPSSATPNVSATPVLYAPYASSSVEVSTTEPIHQNLNPFYSERLIFRTLQESDFPGYHAILKQEQTMVDAGLGPMYEEKSARDWFNMTQESFTRVGIFLKNSDNTEGELIGDGGVYRSPDQWPEIFYLLKKEFWGKGYASEFVDKFKEVWWNLPRKDTRMSVQSISLGKNHTSVATERLCAPIRMENVKSQKVVEKAGFEFVTEFLKEEVKYVFWQNLFPGK